MSAELVQWSTKSFCAAFLTVSRVELGSNNLPIVPFIVSSISKGLELTHFLNQSTMIPIWSVFA